MKLLELVLGLGIVSLISTTFLASSLRVPQSKRSSYALLYFLSRARIMGLVDSSYVGNLLFASSYDLPRTDKRRLLADSDHFLWQLQFHLSGLYTLNSVSVYRDTPRFAHTTDFDKRPLDGDIIAISPSNFRCLTGYNNTNTSEFCKNNTFLFARFGESLGLKRLGLLNNSSCIAASSVRFYFDYFGRARCNFLHSSLEPVTHIVVGSHSIYLVHGTGYSYLPPPLTVH